jgi:phosphonate transport system permease protein
MSDAAMKIELPPGALPSRKLLRLVLMLLATAVVICLLFSYLDLSPSSFVVDFRFIVDLLQQMFPPNIALLWTKRSIFLSLVETLSMAFLGTVFGGALALFLAFFAATNTTPNPLVRIVVRTLLVMNRSVPPLIVILVLLIAVGIGPFAGMLALVFGSVGMYGKFFADTIEQADKGTMESVESLGSTRLQTIRYAVLPQVMPSFVANLFYAFDYNLRAAIPLGIFGGGGIGFELAFANGLLHYKDVLAYTILIVVMITAMERISDWVRRGIITQTQLVTK